MRFKSLTLSMAFLWLSGAAHATEYLVSVFKDDFKAGTLRSILLHACNEPGDDEIRFVKTWQDEIRIVLNSPLVIPHDCQGSVSVYGSNQVETILDASGFSGKLGHAPGATCILHVYSQFNSAVNLTFVHNRFGAGVCLFGQNNTVERSRFIHDTSSPGGKNLYGIVISNAFARQDYDPPMNGRGNEIRENLIQDQFMEGLWVQADEARIEHNNILGNGNAGIRIKGRNAEISANNILANGGCYGDDALDSQTVPCWGSAGYAGIMVEGGSKSLMIGGAEADTSGNIIQYNRGGGIVVLGDAEDITITHNILSKNYESMLGVDLEDDGVTVNDWGDGDAGPNNLLNHTDHFQVFPLVSATDGTERYWSWGLAQGELAEIYAVSDEDIERKVSHGGGDAWLQDVVLTEDGELIIAPEAAQFHTGDWLTSLLFDAQGNTSEFSSNVLVGPDADLDGLVDDLEKGGNFRLNQSSSPQKADSDMDGLPDVVEDKNRNGQWDTDIGETSAYLKDSDGDGVSDWQETHGDGVFDEGLDSDPNGSDSDGDGIKDGKEDMNSNGVWEAYLGETNALSADSDQDGTVDGLDVCPSISDATQNPHYCQS